MNDEAFVVCYPDPNEALKVLERKRFEFECLLDYVAANHPQMLAADFAVDLQDYISETWAKYDLPA